MTARVDIFPSHCRLANPGLQLDKYIVPDPPAERATALQALTERRLDDVAYLLAFRRWERYWRSQPGVFLLKGRVRGRLAVGLGFKGVLEVGLRLQHTYGAPLIPGSAVKGVLKAHVRAGDEKLASLLFGDPDGQALVAMEDAWWIPTPEPPLLTDVVAAHHPRYYTENPPHAPTDFDNPIPVPFLSVRGSFLFIGRFEGDDPGGKWKTYLKDTLRVALESSGIGGKTASGYGRFTIVD
jgi:CRISPR-associated protein Cmr6